MVCNLYIRPKESLQGNSSGCITICACEMAKKCHSLKKLMRQFKKEKIPLPQNTPQFPDSNQQIDLEIGAGAGLHAINYAKTNPQRFIIAVERTRNKFNKMKASYAQNHSPANLLPIHADAIHWLSHYAKKKSLSKVFLFYPNPEPKNKNQRWIHMPFFKELIHYLKDSGEIHLATNKKDYIEEFSEGLKKYPELKSPQGIMKIHRDFEDARTHFEKKYLKRGERCYEIHVVKRSL